VAYFSALFYHFFKTFFGKKVIYSVRTQGRRINTFEEYIPLWVWIRCMEMCSYYNFLHRLHTEPSMKSHMKGNWTVMEESLLRRCWRNCQPLVSLCLSVELWPFPAHIQDDLPPQPWAVLNLLYSSSTKFKGSYKVIVLFEILSVLAVFIWLCMVCFSGIIYPY
jgi:hypothetical protein